MRIYTNTPRFENAVSWNISYLSFLNIYHHIKLLKSYGSYERNLEMIDSSTYIFINFNNFIFRGHFLIDRHSVYSTYKFLWFRSSHRASIDRQPFGYFKDVIEEIENSIPKKHYDKYCKTFKGVVMKLDKCKLK